MGKFIIFLRKIYVFALFILLELAAFSYFYKSSIYTNAKLMNASNIFFGGVYNSFSDIRSYFMLKDENNQLLNRISELQNKIETYEHRLLSVNDSIGFIPNDSLGNTYIYRNARIVKNSTNKQQNYIIIDKGSKHGIEKDMALTNNNSIVGYVLNTSENFSTCISLLNNNFKTSGMGLKEDYYGSLIWDGTSYEYATLIEIPKYAVINEGDTITTTSISSRFPANIMIGTIDSYKLVNGVYYEAKIKLSTPFGKLHYVDVIKYKDFDENIIHDMNTENLNM